jgi:hypothetical protein
MRYVADCLVQSRPIDYVYLRRRMNSLKLVASKAQLWLYSLSGNPSSRFDRDGCKIADNDDP